jgi:MscS family membrane protein
MIRFLRGLAFSTCLFFLPHWNAGAQSLRNLLTGSIAQSSAVSKPTDRLGRTSPHDTIYHFLEACHKGQYNVAAQFLDLRQISPQERASQGPELAKQLGTLLDRNPAFEVSNLSSSLEGSTEDGLPSNLDTLATFDLNGESVNLKLERINQPSGGQIWLVSPDSVSQIRELGGLIGQSPLEKHLPAPLVETKLIGTPLWIWLALVLVGVILSVVSRWLSKLLIAIVRPITARYVKSFHTQRLENLIEPLRLLLPVMVFRACLAFITPSALLRDDLLKLLILLFMLGAASLLMRLVDIVSDTVTSRLDHRERALTYSVFPLGIRFIKILIFCFAVLVVLQQWGYNTTTILAGLGVGGVAIALAAQKTIENLFGGVSLISDRPVLVGDFCQFGGQVGTVEDIGLRSTRIRTLDRTVVTVPNSQFSTMTLENFSKRDRMWFHPTVRLRRDTTPDQVRQMMDAISQILEKHEMVDSSGVPLRFTKITDQTLDLEIFAYILTPDSNEFLKVQSELLLQILEASNRLGIGLAVPIQEEYNVSVDARQANPPHPFLAAQRHNGISPDRGAASAKTEAGSLTRQ